MNTFHIHIEGQVQGVGFRPYVFRLARLLGLPGTVCNGMDGVHVFFNAGEAEARQFYQKMMEALPRRARILRHRMERAASAAFEGFEIVESQDEGKVSLLITPDLGLCEDCRRELFDPADRRFAYPFTTCINCGPRYSIMRQLPYDRPRTTMAPFAMCPPCQAEYDSPLTRRHFSQTNSCPACPVTLSFLSKNENRQEGAFGTVTTDPAECIALAVHAIAEGKILAVKGIGGYLLVCDATNSASVATLRVRKNRPSKPFALMYPDLDSLQKDVQVGEAEATAFTSIESPIVLCRLLPAPASGLDLAGIAPHLDRTGAMQPYTPLMALILSKWGKPIVATSGNLSGSPIFFEDEKALEHLGLFADAFLINDREILHPQDDSVVLFTPEHSLPIVLRRSRGYAPTHIHRNFPDWQASVLAMGADLKSTFSLQHAGNTYVSQYLGDLESYDTQEHFDKTLRHFLRLFDARPERVLVDMHPTYFSSGKGRALAAEWSVPLLPVQHHVAHFAAVLAENELLESKEPVLGVIWDGTGWGSGSNPEIWGGEFFLFNQGKFERVDCLDPFPHFLGDKMAREPRLSALALCRDLPAAEPLLRPHFTEKEWALYRKMLASPGGMTTTSVGRLFDGVASLLGLQQKSSFEGEAAMRLEVLARDCLGKSRSIGAAPGRHGVRQAMVEAVVAGLLAGRDKAEIALSFHQALVQWAGSVARQQGVRQVAFSGGVFQNALLSDLIVDGLGGEFDLYFHRSLSPNDECVSFGQLVFAFMETAALGR